MEQKELTYVVSNLVHIRLVGANLHLLLGNLRRLNANLARKLTVLVTKSLEGSFDRGKLLAKFVMLLCHVVCIKLHFSFQGFQVQVQVRALKAKGFRLVNQGNLP